MKSTKICWGQEGSLGAMLPRAPSKQAAKNKINFSDELSTTVQQWL